MGFIELILLVLLHTLFIFDGRVGEVDHCDALLITVPLA